MTSAKCSDFFTPSPSCHEQKLADFVPFVCILGTHLPHPLRTSYMEAPQHKQYYLYYTTRPYHNQ